MNNKIHCAILVAISQTSHATVTSSEFFSPELLVKPVIGSGSGQSEEDSTGTTADGSVRPVDWSHTASGQTWANVGLLGEPVAEVQLAAFAETRGDALVFGREQTVNLLGIPLGNPVSSLVTTGLTNSWQSTATVNLSLVANETYLLELLVTSPSFVSADLLSTATVGISGGPFTNPDGLALESVDVLSLANIDVISQPASLSLLFTPTSDTDSFSVDFAAASKIGLDVLGGNGDGTQDVLTFSGFAVTPVPEPSAIGLLGLGGVFLLKRRRA